MEINQEKSVKNNNSSYIIPVYQRSKDFVIDTYFLLITNYCSCRNRLICRSAIDNNELSQWRNALRALYLQLREEEAEYWQKYDYKTVENILKNDKDTDKLTEFTEETLRLKALQEIRGISVNKNKDPVQEYKQEAYGNL